MSIMPQQTSTISRPMQLAVVPMQTTTAQLDINTMFNLMLPIIMIVMMMKVMTSAFGEKKPEEA